VREAFNKLSADERHILSEISVNPVYKKLLEQSLYQLRRDLLALNPDDDLFNSKYRALVSNIDFVNEEVNIVLQLFNEFYKPQQGQDVKE